MSKSYFETLESRTLLTGVTIMANTWDSTLGTFVAGAENNLVARLGGWQNVPVYRLNIVQANPNDSSSSALMIQPLIHDGRSGTASNSSVDQILFMIDYSGDPSGATNPVSTSPQYSLDTVAQLVTDYMQNNTVDGMKLASAPIHLMGVSRSTVLMDKIARNFGQAGIWVDDETYMDPHPVSQIGDPGNVVYDSVQYAEDYWRTTGQPETAPYYNGTAVTGAYNQELPYVQAQNGGYGTPHVAPAGYYNATIDLNSTQEFGPGFGSPVYDSWWGTTAAQPPRDKTGFYFSNYIGGTRPVSGVWTYSGGTGSRTATVQTGTQWPDVTDLKISGGNTVFASTPITLNYLHGDRGSATTVTFSLDTDANPINNNDAAANVGSANFDITRLPTVDTISLATHGIAPGTYYLRAKISDGAGHDRYAYTQLVTIQPLVVQVAAAAAAGAPVTTAKTSTLSILGGGPVGEANMIYTWTVTSAPAGAAAPVFSNNGTNAAKSLSVTVSSAGAYTFQCTITDSLDSTIPSATSSASLSVNSVATTLRISPAKVSLARHKTTRLAVKLMDQFGRSMHVPNTLSFKITSGKGASLGPSSGTLKAGSKVARLTVEADLDTLKKSVGVLIV